MGDGRSAAWAERARSFGSVAAPYAVLRPAYPPELVPFLTGSGTGRRVLDLGAGTGLLTELLVSAGHDVVAVDPSAAMLEQLAARLPDVPTVVAGAEALPLPDAAAMTEQRRAAFLGEVRALIATHPDTRDRAVVEVPHVVSAFRLTPR